jgi:predicted Zn finger-like uncharacterized protein
MNGTTLCPHCNTRFRIAGEQLEAHQGMVRCGHCMQPFDARPGFIPDQPDPQLELPIADRIASSASPSPAASAQPEIQASPKLAEAPAPELPKEDAEPQKEDAAEQPVSADKAEEAEPVASEPHDESLDFVQSASGEAASDTEQPAKPLVIQPITRADADEEEAEEVVAKPSRKLRWLWIAASSLLGIALLAQSLYFFRVELAARLPGLKPMLIGYCKALNCTVPLPQNPDLMSIESSELEADPAHVNQITLAALLRNRATHVQAFPVLELSLNDTQDKVLARRLFKPADYLPATESEAAGLRPNRELNIRLKLDTSDLRPTGYRLALFYPQ